MGGQCSATPQQGDRQAGFSAAGSCTVLGAVSTLLREDQLSRRKGLRGRASGGLVESGAHRDGDELRWTHKQRSGFLGLC